MPSRLNGPRLMPASGKPDRLVVLLHGYGADGGDLITLGNQWRVLLPTAAFVAPNAPERCALSPQGYQWFPIARMNLEELRDGVRAVAPALNAFLDEELQRLGLDGSRLALVGFSQGTMLALHAGLQRAPAPAAILGFSGALADPEILPKVKSRPPIMLIHGDQDSTIPVDAMHVAVRVLGAAGQSVRFHVSRGLGHGIDGAGLALGGRFLADAFNGRSIAAAYA